MHQPFVLFRRYMAPPARDRSLLETLSFKPTKMLFDGVVHWHKLSVHRRSKVLQIIEVHPVNPGPDSVVQISNSYTIFFDFQNDHRPTVTPRTSGFALPNLTDPKHNLSLSDALCPLTPICSTWQPN